MRRRRVQQLQWLCAIVLCCVLVGAPPRVLSESVLEASDGCLNATLVGQDCVLTGVNLMWTASKTIIVINGSLILSDSNLEVKCQTTAEHCFLQLQIGGSITMHRSSAVANVLNVSAEGDLLVLDNSRMSSSASNGPGFLDRRGERSGGGGHAGSGARHCNDTKNLVNSDRGDVFGLLRGGNGVCTSEADRKVNDPGGLGGGIIAISVTQSVVVNGSIAADGAAVNLATSATSAPPTPTACGGGAGGTIHIAAASVTIGSVGSVSARGGSGRGGGGGGSGGRIFLLTSALQERDPNVPTPTSIFVGGGFSGGQPCQIGAAGTILVAAPGGRADLYVVGATSFGFTAVSELVISESEPYGLSNITMVGANVTVVPEVPSSPLLVLVTGSLRLLQFTLLTLYNVRPTVLQTSTAVIDLSSSLHYLGDLFLELSSMEVHGLMAPAPLKRVDTRLFLKAQTLYVGSGQAGIFGGSVFITADHVQVDGGLVEAFRAPKCAALNLSSAPCTEYPPRASLQYTLWVNASTINVAQLGDQQQLQGSVVCMCATSLLRIDGKVSASGLGCSNNQGEGAGGANPEYPGGGAGHGGMGGAGRDSFGDVNNGGKAFDSVEGSSIPDHMGSGGGGDLGGIGGGVVHVVAADTLIVSGAVVADGESGRDSRTGGGGGGGSGGTIIFKVGRVFNGSKAAVLSASGGDGGTDGGGGGGGGWLLLEEFPGSQLQWNSHIPVLASGGKQASPGSPGAEGQKVHRPACGSGTEGVFCSPCRAGHFKPQPGDAACAKCAPGTHQPNTGATSCLPCKPGFFSQAGFATCQHCDNGTSSGPSASSCFGCPPGTYGNYATTTCETCDAHSKSTGNASFCTTCADGSSSAPGSSRCFPCPAGSFSNQFVRFCEACLPASYSPGNISHCLPCELGQTAGYNASTCHNCTSKPSNSEYISNKDCSYQCDAGLVRPHCVTPFQQLVSELGGPIGFSLIVLVVASFVAAPFLYCHCRYKKAVRRQAIRDLAEVRGGAPMGSHGKYHALSDTGSPQNKAFHPLGLSFLDALQLHVSDSDQGITEDQLAHCVHRIYFHGTNSFSAPFSLPARPHVSLRQLVHKQAYRHYCDEMCAAGAWQPWEKNLFYVLVLFYYPLAQYFLEVRRQTHVARMVEYHSKYNHGFLKNYRARALCNSLKFGFSRCFTLAWVDVLVMDQAEAASLSQPIGRPSLPMVLLCSGDGSFYSPFYLDMTDPMVKCAAQYFGPGWFSFVSHLNCHLRTINTVDSTTLKSSIEYMNVMTRMGVGIGAKMPLAGLRIDIGYLPHNPDSAADAWRPAIIISESPKSLSLRSSRSPSANASPQSTMVAAPVAAERMRRSQSAMLGASDARAAEHKRHPSKYQTLDDMVLLEEDSSGDELDDYDQSGFGPSAQFVSSSSGVLGSQGLIYGVRKLGDVYNVEKLRKPAKDVGFWSKVYAWVLRVTLVNVTMLLSRVLVGVALGFLLAGHLVLNFAVAATFVQIVHALYWVIVLIPPFADFISPLLGLAALVSSSPAIARRFALFNTLSIINALIALLIGCLHARRLGWFGLGLPLIMIVDKLMLAFFGNIFIAHAEFARDYVVSRKDFLRNKSVLGSPLSLVDAKALDVDGAYTYDRLANQRARVRKLSEENAEREQRENSMRLRKERDHQRERGRGRDRRAGSGRADKQAARVARSTSQSTGLSTRPYPGGVAGVAAASDELSSAMHAGVLGGGSVFSDGRESPLLPMAGSHQVSSQMYPPNEESLLEPQHALPTSTSTENAVYYRLQKYENEVSDSDY